MELKEQFPAGTDQGVRSAIPYLLLATTHARPELLTLLNQSLSQLEIW